MRISSCTPFWKFLFQLHRPDIKYLLYLIPHKPINNSWMVILNGKVLPEYLSVFMNLERSKKMLYSMAKGAVGQANINAKEVQSIEIVIPPMDIQNSFLTLSRQSDKSKLCFHLHTTTLHYAHS